MTYTFRNAVRERVSVIFGIAGASGSGKTLSALKLARGLASGDDSKIAFIDTEAGRGLHYAVAAGERPGPERFAFQYCDLRPPFSPQAYMDVIAAADAAGFEVIVVDSVSHIMEGEGGLHDMHDAAVDEAVEKAKAFAQEKNWRFDEAMTRDKASVGAWREPKRQHKRFVNKLLQCRAHLVLCLRADEKLRMETTKDDRGRNKTVIVQAKDLPPAERWVPICEKRFPYELTVSLILTPTAPGIPIPIKLQEQHKAALPTDRHISEETGRQLAAWARGEKPAARGENAAAPGGEGAASLRGSLPEPEANPEAESYVSYAETQIEEMNDRTQLLTWWNSDFQKEERRKAGLTKESVAALVAKVKAKAAALAAAAEQTVGAE